MIRLSNLGIWLSSPYWLNKLAAVVLTLRLGSNNSSLEIIKHKYKDDKQVFQIKYNNKIYLLNVNLIGKVQIKNILMAMIAAEKSGLKFEKLVKTINKITNVNGRFEKVGKLKNNSTVILDYAHTPDALKTCLENIKDQFNLNTQSYILRPFSYKNIQVKELNFKICEIQFFCVVFSC